MFIARYFPGDNPIGKRVRLGGPDSEQDWLTIVGVVPDLHMAGVGNDDTDHSGLYIPLLQSDARFMSIAVRTSGPPLGLASEMRDAVMSVDADMPIYWVKSMAKRIDEATWFFGVFGTLFVVFGFAALFLASVGLYGVMAFSVTRRTQEVGVRMALGAQTRDVLLLVLRQGLVQLGIGLTAGFGLAALLANMMKIVLFRVEPMDTTIFLTIPVVLIVTGLLACLVPARRATRVDPMVALQHD